MRTFARGGTMTVKEHRMRKIMFAEGESVLVRDGESFVPGKVHTVGWMSGSYRVRVGRRILDVSMTQVRNENGGFSR
jgi:hypothetical protein